MTVTVKVKAPVISATDSSFKQDLQRIREFHAAADKAGGHVTVQDLIDLGLINSAGKKK